MSTQTPTVVVTGLGATTPLGGDVSSMVPPEIAAALAARFSDLNRDGAGTNYVVSLQE